MDFRRPVSDGPSESIGYIVYILDDYFNIYSYPQPSIEMRASCEAGFTITVKYAFNI